MALLTPKLASIEGEVDPARDAHPIRVGERLGGVDKQLLAGEPDPLLEHRRITALADDRAVGAPDVDARERDEEVAARTRVERGGHDGYLVDEDARGGWD